MKVTVISNRVCRLITFVSVGMFYTNVSVADDLSGLSLDELLKVSVATRDQQSVITAPANVSVFTRYDIEALGISSVQELLNLVPGFISARDIEQGTADRVSVRGRSTALSESVLFLIDGQRINDLYSGGISLLNRSLSIDNVAQVEVIRGPGSALYGSNAFLGVVNIITRNTASELTIRAGSLGHGSVSWLNNGTIGSDKEWNVYLSHMEESGDDYELVDAFGLFAPTSDAIAATDFYSSLSVGAWDFDVRFMQRELDDFLVFGNHGDNREETRQWSVSAEYHQSLSEQFSWSARASLARDRWNTRATLIPAGTEIAPGEFLTETFFGGPLLETEELNVNFDATWLPKIGHSVLFGIGVQQDDIVDVANVTTHNPITLEYFGQLQANRNDLNFLQPSDRDILSAYLQYQWQISPLWQLTSGVRLDDYSDFGSSVNPRIALVFHKSKTSSIKLLYATAFRAPNFLELYDKNNPVDFGNSELYAEEVATSEISWLERFGPLRLEMNYFYNQFDHLIQLGASVVDPDNPLNAPGFVNSDSGYNSGVETVVNLRVSDTFGIELVATWLKDTSFNNMPQHYASIRFAKGWDKFQLGMTGQWVEQSSAHSDLQDYQYWNAHLKYRYSESMSWSLNAKNVFDKHFMTFSSVLPQGTANRGRQWVIAYNYYF